MYNEKTRHACVIGHPISHSLSPHLHQYWLDKYNINGTYKAIDVPPAELEDFLRGMHDNNLRGCNITIPHKVDAMQYMDYTSLDALNIGAINTVYLSLNHDENIIELNGMNTDTKGFLRHLKQSQPKWESKNKTVMVIGAGGAARAVINALLSDQVEQVYVTNRTSSKVYELIDMFKPYKIPVHPIDWNLRDDDLSGIDLIVNATSLGMVDQPALDIDLKTINPNAIAYDIVYRPLETAFLKQAEEYGCEIVTGLGMLLHQAAPAFEQFFYQGPDFKAEVTPELEQYIKELI